VDPNEFATKDYVTLGIALWGAALSTILAARQIWRGRPGVKVLITPLGAPHEDGSSRHYWWVRVVNHRERPIEITQVGLIIKAPRPHGRGHYIPDVVSTKHRHPDALPATLGDGEGVTRYFKRADMSVPYSHPVVGAFARDSLDREYEGRITLGAPTSRLRRLKIRWMLFRLGVRPKDGLNLENGGWPPE
jgi:hypothetical protein